MTSAAPLRIKSFIERIESVETDQADRAKDKREIYAEARAEGYDVKTLRWAVQERKIDAAARAERDDLRDTYAHALGMAVEAVSSGDMSLREAARTFGVSKSSIHRGLPVPGVSREMTFGDLGEWLPPHDPETGEIGEASQGVSPATSVSAPLGSPEREARPPANPTAAVWVAILAARDAWEEGKRKARQAEIERRRAERAERDRVNAAIDADPLTIPPFLRRAA